MFIPGETVTHTFSIPYSPLDMKLIIVSYRQFDRLILRKPVTDPSNIRTTEDGAMISVHLSEEESLLFLDDSQYSIQINVLFNDQGRAASKEIFQRTGIQQIQDTSDEIYKWVEESESEEEEEEPEP